MGRTSIEWTRNDDGSPGYSWPIVNGCRRVSAGCENCYAERLTATRLSKTPKYQGLAVMGKNGPRWTGETRLWPHHLDMPLRIRKPSRIFVADMGDLFYEGVHDDEIAAVLGVMALCPQHTFQVLTKRPERMQRWFRQAPDTAKRKVYSTVSEWALRNAEDIGKPADFILKSSSRYATLAWPLPNVWLGVSVEDQATADERIPLLLGTPATVRFVSYEPALGPVQFDSNTLGCVGHLAETFGNPLINWVIVGGESGPRARPFDIRWARSTIDQCRAAGVPCFVKQLGARPFEQRPCDAPACNCGGQHDHPVTLDDKKGGDIEEWKHHLDDLRVREFPQPRAAP